MVHHTNRDLLGESVVSGRCGGICPLKDNIPVNDGAERKKQQPGRTLSYKLSLMW